MVFLFTEVFRKSTNESQLCRRLNTIYTTYTREMINGISRKVIITKT